MFIGDYNENASEVRSSRQNKSTAKGFRRAGTNRTAVGASRPKQDGYLRLVSRPTSRKLRSEPKAVGPIEIKRTVATESVVGEASEPSTVGTALSAYLRDIGQVALLTRNEEIELAAQIKQGNQAARERMIRANLRLVVKIARDYENLGLPLLDLISEGTIGLMKAVDRFDPAKGGKLSTYGSLWIKQQIRRALSNQGRTIRLPVHVEAKLYRMGRAEVRLREVLGREPTDEELADEMKTDARRVGRLRSAAFRPTALDAPVGEDGDGTLGELVGDGQAVTPAEAYAQKNDQHLLLNLVNKLPTREASILRCRFGLQGETELTLEDIGRQFDLTRERIRQLQNEALEKLRAMMEDPQTVIVEARTR